MKIKPPPIAAWLLRHLGPRYHGESLAGDLFEELQLGRSRTWYWRQTLAAIGIGTITRLRIRGRISLKRLLGAIGLTALTTGAIAWAGNAPSILQHRTKIVAPGISTSSAAQETTVGE